MPWGDLVSVRYWATCSVSSPAGGWSVVGAFDGVGSGDAVRWVTECLAQVYADASVLFERSRGVLWAANEGHVADVLEAGYPVRLVFASDHVAAVWEVRRVRFLRLVDGGELSPECRQRAVPRLWRCPGRGWGPGGVDLMAVAARSAVSEKGKSW